MKNTPFEENHIHSNFSDGKYSLKEIFEYNNLYNKLNLLITDHVDKNTNWFERYVQEINGLKKSYPDFSVKIGCEVKILDNGSLNTTDKILNSSEVVLGAVHHFDNMKEMNPQEFLDREYELTEMLASSSEINVLTHPFSMSVRWHRLEPTIQQIRKTYELCVKNKIKFEYTAKYALDNMRAFIRNEIDKGNIDNFSFGSDVHNNLAEIGEAAFSLMKPITILVTGTGSGLGQTIIKAIKLSRVKSRIITTDHQALTAGTFRGDSAYLVPLANNEEYINKIIEISDKENVQVIIPGTDIELPFLSANKSKIEEQTQAKVIVSDLSAVEIADDKWKTVQFLKKNGFDYPESALKKNARKIIDKKGFPVMVKPRIGARSVNCYIVKDENELAEALEVIPEPIIQEYLVGENQEYTCGVFFNNNENYGAICMRRWLRNGDTYKAIAKHNPKMENFVIKVAEKLKINGPCNFQLRKANNAFKIFEINCRFSGTTAARSFLGFNIINAILQQEFFNRPIKKLNFKESCILRYWNEVFTNLDELQTLANQGYLKNPHSDTNII